MTLILLCRVPFQRGRNDFDIALQGSIPEGEE
jgi:hypothetical protein